MGKSQWLLLPRIKWKFHWIFFFIFVGILQRLSSTKNPVLVVISIVVVVVVVFFHLSPIPVSTFALLFN